MDASHNKTDQALRFMEIVTEYIALTVISGQMSDEQQKRFNKIVLDLSAIRLLNSFTQISEFPKNNFTKREDAVTFFDLFSGFGGYMQSLEADPVNANKPTEDPSSGRQKDGI